MQALIQFMLVLRLILALLVGGAIGYGFGLVQLRALRRYEKMQIAGKLKHYVGVMPGSMRRVAFLLLVLLIVQVLCPVFFADGTQWWVSGGVMLGYGCHMFQQLQAKRKAG